MKVVIAGLFLLVSSVCGIPDTLSFQGFPENPNKFEDPVSSDSVAFLQKE
jgi:hypothetical protein